MLGWDRNYELEVRGPRTLTSVLEEARAPEVDLLSLDVEGYEADVLRGLDFERWAPRYLLVEVVDADRRRAVDGILAGRYEHVEQLSPFDVLFTLRARPR